MDAVESETKTFCRDIIVVLGMEVANEQIKQEMAKLYDPVPLTFMQRKLQKL